MSYLAKLKEHLADPAQQQAEPFEGFEGDRGTLVSADQSPHARRNTPAFFYEEERKLKNQFFSEKKSLTDAGQPVEKTREIRVGDEPSKPSKGSKKDHVGPALWQAKLYNLSSCASPCPGFHDREWRRVFDASHAFLQAHADTAHALGWDAISLFGVHPVVGASRVDCCGALMVSAGTHVVLVERDVISFDRGRFYRRLFVPDAVLVWEFGR